MRLNYLNQYREVARLINAPTKPVAGDVKQPTSSFGPLIGSLLTEPLTKQPLSTSGPLNPPPQGDVMARYQFPEPNLPAPQPPQKIDERPTLPNMQGGVIKESSPGVNPPTVLSTRRVMVETPAAQNILPVPDIMALANKAGSKHGVDPILATAVVAAESSFDARAISSDGHASKGLMQLLDSTGRHLLAQAGLEEKYDPFHPEQNVDLGVGYLRHLHEIFKAATPLKNDQSTFAAANSASLEKLAVAAFNAGEGRIAAAQARALSAGANPGEYNAIENYLPKSTQEYVQRITRLKGEFEPRFEAEG